MYTKQQDLEEKGNSEDEILADKLSASISNEQNTRTQAALIHYAKEKGIPQRSWRDPESRRVQGFQSFPL